MDNFLIQETKTYTVFEYDRLVYLIKNLEDNVVHCEFDKVDMNDEDSSHSYWIVTVVYDHKE